MSQSTTLDTPSRPVRGRTEQLRAEGILLGLGCVHTAATLSEALVRSGYQPNLIDDLNDFCSALEQAPTRVVVLDLDWAAESAPEMLRRIPGQGRGLVVLSRQAGEAERVASLELGADDHLPLPVSPRELVARLRALSRRLAAPAEAQEAAPPRLAMGVLLDPARQRLVPHQGAEIHLTGAEAGLLAMMLRDPALTAERDMIAEHVLGYRRRPQQRGVDQFASSLRQKLEQSSNGAIQLLAVRGRGYRLVW